MASAAMLIGWNRVVAGREKQALELFNESLTFYGKLVNDKKLESFEPVVMRPHGGDMNGFILLRGTPEQIDGVRRAPQFEDMMVRGLHCLDRLGAVDAYVGEGMSRIMEMYAKTVSK